MSSAVSPDHNHRNQRLAYRRQSPGHAFAGGCLEGVWYRQLPTWRRSCDAGRQQEFQLRRHLRHCERQI